MPHRSRPNDDPRPEKGKRKSFAQSYGAVDPTRAVGTADWGAVSPQAIQGLVSQATAEGGAVLLGYSRDRGAYHIVLMDDGGKVSRWVPCSTDVDAALEDIAQELWAFYHTD